MERNNPERSPPDQIPAGEEQTLFASILDACPAAINAKDVHGRYIVVNRQWETLANLSRDRVKGKTDFDLFTSETADASSELDKKVLEVDVRSRLRELINQVFRDVPCGAGTTGFIKINQKQLCCMMPDGWWRTVMENRQTPSSLKPAALWLAPTQPPFPAAPWSVVCRNSAPWGAAPTFWKCSPSRRFITPKRRWLSGFTKTRSLR